MEPEKWGVGDEGGFWEFRRCSKKLKFRKWKRRC